MNEQLTKGKESLSITVCLFQRKSIGLAVILRSWDIKTLIAKAEVKGK